MRISVGKAAANALAAWLKQSLPPDVKVRPTWPQSSVQIKGRALTIVRIGRRRREDQACMYEIITRTNISATQCQVRFRLGDLTQPMQLDIWCDSEDGRDDLVEHLDQALHAGQVESLNIKNSTQTVYSDPVADDLVLPFDPEGSYAGMFCTFEFDEDDIDDSPDSIQRSEYRSTWIGESHMPYTILKTVPRLANATLKTQLYTEIPQPSLTASPYQTTTLTAGKPIKVTRGTSTS